MFNLKLSMLVLVCSLIAAKTNAQGIYYGPGGPVVSPVYQPYQPYQPAYRPSVPVFVSPDQFNGVNFQTGGIDTSNTQVNNTAFDFGRNQSQFNGTERQVQRPVYGQNGQIVGYQEGTVWNNSITGQEHGDLNTFTPNGMGGVQQTKNFYSPAP